MNFKEEKNIAVLLMAGNGSRFSSKEPKQYFLIKGKPLFSFAAKALDDSQLIDFIIYVVPKGCIEKTSRLINSNSLSKEHIVIEGADSREESSFAALKYLSDSNINEKSLVLIQDADRPFLSERLIEENIQKAREEGAALTTLPSTDSLALISESKIEKYLPRKDIYLLQTPQTFAFSLIFDAFCNAKLPLNEYTDDGSLLLEKGDVKPVMVLGNKGNIKVTEAADLNVVEDNL